VPFLAGLKPSGDRGLVDMGKMTLRAAGQFAPEVHEGRSLPVWGEPPSRSSDQTARLTSEPWFDADGDRNYTDVDRFRDVDANGTFSKDLYFKDVDGDGMRRIGLVDKYIVGRWDAELISDDRPRPDLKKPEPKKPEPQPKPAAPQTAPKPVPKPATPRASPPEAAKRPESAPTTPPTDAGNPAAEKTKDGLKDKDKMPAQGGGDKKQAPPEKQPEDDF
jgi:hypothetical protein